MNGLADDLCHPRLRFVGAFDTVPGDGYDKLKLMKVHPIKDLNLPASVEHAAHLLSVDDNRIPSFQPLLWEGQIAPGQTLEQIWMPGVHADIGGCSDGVFIGNLAVLTMIEILGDRCPELLFDTGFVSRLEAMTFTPHAILQITNERRGFWRKLLRKKRRSAAGGANQTRHYLLEALPGRTLLVRNKRQIYCAQHITRVVDGKSVTRYQSKIDGALAMLGEQGNCCHHCRQGEV